MEPSLVVWCDGDGSDFADFIHHVRGGMAGVHVAGVVSTHTRNGVEAHANALHIPFTEFTPPYTAEHYQEVLARLIPGDAAKFSLFLDWNEPIYGLNSAHTFCVQAILDGGGGVSFVSGHFVMEEKPGPVFFRRIVALCCCTSEEARAARLHQEMHQVIPWLVHSVVNGRMTPQSRIEEV